MTVVVTAGDSDKVTFEQSQEKVREGAMWDSGGRVFQGENTASAKVLRQA